MKKTGNVLKKRTELRNLLGRVKRAARIFGSVRRNRKRLMTLAKGIRKIARDSRKRRAYG